MTTPIIIHLITVLPALITGVYILASKKGTRIHKRLGRVWAGLMLITAIDSFFIQKDGSFSWIHILSCVSISSILLALWAIRNGHSGIHQRFMLGAFIGVVVAGYFATMTPGRAVYNFLFDF